MNDVNFALHKITRGAGIVFFGTIILFILGFFTRIVVARAFSTSEYGIFNLTLTILNIGLIIAKLGFQNSLPREIAFYRSKNQLKEVEDVISTALSIVTISSLFLMAVLTSQSYIIAEFFHNDMLSYTIRITTFALPFSVLVAIITSISRSFGRIRESIYYQNIFNPLIFLILLLINVYFNFKFEYIFISYILSWILTFLILIMDIWRLKLFNFSFSFNMVITKRLIVFSLPLMITGILVFIMNWTDTLMIGYYLNPENVGIYNAASPLARTLTILLTSTAFLYMPVATQLYAQEKIEEIRRVYQILTKWIFLLTIPVFAITILFPETVIKYTFGLRYVEASLALQILSLGFMFHTLLGLNGVSLIVIGKPNLNLLGDTVTTIFNILLNIFLIPKYGIFGASLATSISYITANILRSFWLYREVKIHPLRWDYLKLIIISFVLLGIIHSLHLEFQSILYVIITLIIFLSIYILIALLSGCINIEDIELLLLIKERIGINLRIFRKLLDGFKR